MPVSQFEYVSTKWYTRCSNVRPAKVIPSSLMCVKSDAHSRPGTCTWPKYTSRAGPSVARQSLIRRCSVRICPSLNRPGCSRCSHSNSVLASRPGLSSICFWTALPHLAERDPRGSAMGALSSVRWATVPAADTAAPSSGPSPPSPPQSLDSFPCSTTFSASSPARL